jgi:hypothetical protein
VRDVGSGYDGDVVSEYVGGDEMGYMGDVATGYVRDSVSAMLGDC